MRPVGVQGVRSAFMFSHGGGWMLGCFPTRGRFVSDLVADSSAAAVFANDTPSPESRYPVTINEAYAVTKWVAENGAQIDVDGKRLAVAGNIMGGNTDPKQWQEIYASPLLATTEDLKGLPLALAITAEKDVLRDEGEAYNRKLDASGVTVVTARYNGIIHDFGLLNVLSEVLATRAALHQASEELKTRRH